MERGDLCQPDRGRAAGRRHGRQRVSRGHPERVAEARQPVVQRRDVRRGEPADVITEPASVPRAHDSSGELRRRIVQLADAASIELTAGDEAPVAALAAELPPGATVYVAPPAKAPLEDVVPASLAVEAAGLRACPHLV